MPAKPDIFGATIRDRENESMSWTYSQSSGKLSRNGQTILVGCYAGRAEGLNNPAMQDRIGIGPLPQARYLMTALIDSPHTGLATILLDPKPGREMFGRSLFRIHGDNEAANHTGSDGCIVAGHAADREAIWHTLDHELEVVA